MATTQTKPTIAAGATTPLNKGQVAVLAAPRLLPPPDNILKKYEVDLEGWRTLTESIFPAAKTQTSVMMALEYCSRRRLDIFKHPVHIVPIWNAQANDGRGGMVETIWPGINELRTTAIRTGQYAGMDVPVFGPPIEGHFEGSIKTRKNGGDQWEKVQADVEYPEWCQITVYRVLGGNRVPFPGPRVYWLETYSRIRNNCEVPNSMWEKRANGQLEKCAEAAALRRAFPEELGSDYSIDEIGAFTTHAPTDVTADGSATTGGAAPAEPKVGDFVDKPKETAPPAEQKKEAPADNKKPRAPRSKKATPETESKPTQNRVTDVVDENETAADPGKITFQEFNTAKDFFEFSEKWLADEGRTADEAKQWEAFYREQMARIAKLTPESAQSEKTKESYAKLQEALADAMVQYNLILSKAEQPAETAQRQPGEEG